VAKRARRRSIDISPSVPRLRPPQRLLPVFSGRLLQLDLASTTSHEMAAVAFLDYFSARLGVLHAP